MYLNEINQCVRVRFYSWISKILIFYLWFSGKTKKYFLENSERFRILLNRSLTFHSMSLNNKFNIFCKILQGYQQNMKLYWRPEIHTNCWRVNLVSRLRLKVFKKYKLFLVLSGALLCKRCTSFFNCFSFNICLIFGGFTKIWDVEYKLNLYIL